MGNGIDALREGIELDSAEKYHCCRSPKLGVGEFEEGLEVILKLF